MDAREAEACLGSIVTNANDSILGGILKSSSVRLFISGVLVLLVSIGLAHAKGADPETATKVAETQVRLISQRLAKTNYLSAPYTLSTNNLKYLYSKDEKLLA